MTFLHKQQKRVWISLFVIDLRKFIEDHSQVLEMWQDDFLDTMIAAAKRR